MRHDNQVVGFEPIRDIRYTFHTRERCWSNSVRLVRHAHVRAGVGPIPSLDASDSVIFRACRMLAEGKMPQVFKLAATAAALLTVAVSVPLVRSLAQQTRAMPEINLPDVVAEVQQAHDRYNDAINAGNVAVINATFHNDDRTIRFGQADIEFSYKEIEA